MILENLQPLDLQDLIAGYVEIDAYECKLSPNNIVLTFFVDGQDPANDLVQCLEFSSKQVLDVECSMAPNSRGQYLVFVEMTRQDFARKAVAVLKIASYLSGQHTWIYLAYGRKGRITV